MVAVNTFRLTPPQLGHRLPMIDEVDVGVEDVVIMPLVVAHRVLQYSYGSDDEQTSVL